MNTAIPPMGTLAVIFGIFSIWWIATTLKEGRKAEAEIRDRRIRKANNASLEEQKEKLNRLLNK